MNSKKLLRFYFSAGSLNKAMDNLIYRCAISSAKIYYGGDKGAERIIEIIEHKKKLSKLWNYLNGVMQDLNDVERNYLYVYSCSRVIGERAKLDDRKLRAVKMKFTRHTKDRLVLFDDTYKIINDYYAVMGVDD